MADGGSKMYPQLDEEDLQMDLAAEEFYLKKSM
jgi:hypothetical protein